MSEYLNLTGIISLKELTNALQNGKLSTQLKKIQREYFPDRAFRRIIVESVKVDIDSNGLRITPSLVQTASDASHAYQDTEAVSYKKNESSEATQKNLVPAAKAPPIPARSSSLYHINNCILHENHKEVESHQKVQDHINRFQRKSNPTISFLKSRSSQKKYNERKEQTLHHCTKKVAKPKIPPRERPHSDTDADIEKLGKRLEGIVSRRKNRLLQISSDSKPRFMNQNLEKFSCGWRWHRDFESTDDESLWDRLGSVFSSERKWSSSNKSVTSGDYCIHDIT